jgi:hypothetical protein
MPCCLANALRTDVRRRPSDLVPSRSDTDVVDD